MGFRSHFPRFGPPGVPKQHSIPLQLIGPACFVLLDVEWDVTPSFQTLNPKP